MIEVSNLSKSYGDRLAIDKINFNISKGEVVGFLGPNGAGKSTTMKIITGFMAPSAGLVKVAGYDVFENPIEVKKRIGYLPETPPLYGDMLVEDYLIYVANLKACDSNEIPRLVEQSVEKTGPGDVKRRLIQNLSEGFRQRVGIAQALVSDPEILILDEPTVGLDPKQVAEIRKLIQALKGQHTVVLSTHILPEVQSVCERIIIINEGKIVLADSLEGLSRRASGGRQVSVRVLQGSNFKKIMSDIAGITSVELDGDQFILGYDGNRETLAKISVACSENGCGLVESRPHEFALEDVFINLTSGGE